MIIGSICEITKRFWSRVLTLVSIAKFAISSTGVTAFAFTFLTFPLTRRFGMKTSTQWI